MPAFNELSLIADEHAVRALMHRYSDAITRRDYAAWGDCWAENAVWELGPPINGRHQGRAAIVEEGRRTVDSFEVFVQMVHNIVVELRGDTARTRATYHEFARAPEGVSAPFPAIADFALYEDDVRRDRDGRWRFVKRSYNVVFFDTTRPAGGTWPAPFSDSTF
jgi:ketosteroid isomerase-like protein